MYLTRYRLKLNQRSSHELASLAARPRLMLATDQLPLSRHSTVSSNADCSGSGLVLDHGRPASPIQHVQPLSIRGIEQDSDLPASQVKSGLWTEVEIVHLKRLVTDNTVSSRINWVEVHRKWQSISLPSRTKAALSAKYRSVMRKEESLVTRVSSDCGEVCMSNSGEHVDANLSNSGEQVSHDLSINGEQIEAPSQSANGTPLSDEDAKLKGDVESLFKKHLRHLAGRKKPVKLPIMRGRGLAKIIAFIDEVLRKEIDAVSFLSWRKLTRLLITAAVTATKIRENGERLRTRNIRNWVASMKEKINSLRSIIGKASAELGRRRANKRPTNKQIRNIRMLKKQYGATSTDELVTLVSQLGDRLQLTKSRLELHCKDAERVNLRKRFSMKTLDRVVVDDTENMIGPDATSVRAYWKTIVGRTKPFDRSNAELLSWAASTKQRVEESQESQSEDHDDALIALPWRIFESCLKKMKPWKAPGPDGLHAYWWKVFPSAGRALYKLMSECIQGRSSLPAWITRGRVVLIYKSGDRSNPANFRPIACLNTSYKLVTSMIASLLRAHAEGLQVLPQEQVAIRRGTWGCTHAMLLDQAAVADATNQKQKPLHVAWIDYAKAFDSVPHAYIKWLLECMGIPEKLLKFISGLMDKWTVQYEVRDSQGKTQTSAPLAVKSGVLQGDSFSPLLFCFAMAPLSHAINNLKLGYASSAGGRRADEKFYLSHLFYMDDLKVYSTSAGNLDTVLNAIERVSGAISMLVNAKKCARFSHEPSNSSRNTNMSAENNSEVGVVPSIRALEVGETYKYLGIEQRLGINTSDAWKRAKDKFMKALKRIWETNLTVKRKVNCSNSLIAMVSFVTRNSFYSSGTFKSALARGDKLDRSIRALLVRLDARYKSNAVARLYLHPSKGGYGLNSVRDAVAESVIYAWAYICTVPELTKQRTLFQSLARRTKRSIISDAECVLQETGCNTCVERGRVLFDGKEYSTPRDLARAVVQSTREKREIERYASWKGLAVAGKVLRANLNLELSFRWLEVGQLNAVATRNVLAAQEGCLLTRAHPSNQEAQSNCRKCSAQWETPEHILTNCSRWLPNLYIARHDSVVRCIHYLCCLRAELATPHYTQSIPTVLSNERYKLYSNYPIQTKAIIRHNKPDIVMYDTATKVVYVVEVAVSWYTRLELQRNIKHSRYAVNGNHDSLDLPYPRGENLVKELSSEGWEVQFAVIIMGACGEACDNILEELAKIGIVNEIAKDCISRMSRSAVLGSNRIIKQHLV